MMPELGKYATEVLSSYMLALTLIILLIVVSLLRARKMRRELAKIEQRTRPDA